MSPSARPILLVEDNPMDVDLAYQAFREEGPEGGGTGDPAIDGVPSDDGDRPRHRRPRPAEVEGKD